MFCRRPQSIFLLESLSEDVQIFLSFSLCLGEGGEESALY